MSRARMDDLPDLINLRFEDIDIYGSQSYADSSILRPSSHSNEFNSAGKNAISYSQQDHGEEVLKRIWMVNAALGKLNETIKIETTGDNKPLTTKTVFTSENFPNEHVNCWGFQEMMPLQSAIVEKDFSACTNTFISTSSNNDDRVCPAAPSNSPVTFQIQREGVEEVANQNLVDPIQTQFDRSSLDFGPQYPTEKYQLSAFCDVHIVGQQSFFFVEGVSHEKDAIRKSLSLFQIQLSGPNGSIQNLLLVPDRQSNVPGRYICSFRPAETGSHVLSMFVNVNDASNACNKFSQPSADAVFLHIKGSPMFIRSRRSYADSAGHNFVRMGFDSDKIFCKKAWGVAAYRLQNWIYITDRENNEVIILDESGKIIGKFGGKGSISGKLYRPTGVAVDHIRKRVIISDKDNHRISVFDLKGNFIFNFGKKGYANGELNFPWGVAVSPNGGNIAVSDSRNHRIQIFDVNGIFLKKYSVFEFRPYHYKEEFNYPRGIAYNLDGSQLYVTDFHIQAAYVLNMDLTRKEILVQPNLLSRPQGITVDEAGNVLIADSRNSCIRVVSPEGKHICTLGSSGEDKFDRPMDVAVLRGGKLAVVDRGNRFRIF